MIEMPEKTSHIRYPLRKVAEDVTYNRSVTVEDLAEEPGVFFLVIEDSRTTGKYFGLMENNLSVPASHVRGWPTRRPFTSLNAALAEADKVLKESRLDGFDLDEI
jgi:hypothetical protein